MNKDRPPALIAQNYSQIRPKEYGRYLVVHKDGKTHLETWNTQGWAYNEKSIEWFYLPKIH